jgi:hypothetical protein
MAENDLAFTRGVADENALSEHFWVKAFAFRLAPHVYTHITSPWIHGEGGSASRTEENAVAALRSRRYPRKNRQNESEFP